MHLLLLDMPAEHSCAAAVAPGGAPAAAASLNVNRLGLRARSDRPGFLERGARLGARARSEDDVDVMEWECAGVERTASGAMGWQWRPAAAWVLEERSRMPPWCLAPPPAREGENSLTFAKASVMFSLSASPKFIVNLIFGGRARWGCGVGARGRGLR